MSLLSNLYSLSTAPGNRSWCRPTHRTNCVAVPGGGTCCICIPSTATCWVIEMWGQGGGGAGSCCCMGALYGGQAGDYAWVTCSTSGTSHTICVCVCSCNCCNSGSAGYFTGSPGQATRVCNCSTGVAYNIAAAACSGTTNCWFVPAACIYVWDVNTAHTPLSFACCWSCNYSNNVGGACQGACYCCYFQTEWPGTAAGCANYFVQNLPFRQIQGTHFSGCVCNCCQAFNFYVRGGCGFSVPSQYANYASDQTFGFNAPCIAYCGAGMGQGGMAYAGGAAQCCDCSGNAAIQHGGVNGNSPGGGGSSAAGTGQSGGCCFGSCGGLGLVLVSWS